jgi:hypothetical protein
MKGDKDGFHFMYSPVLAREKNIDLTQVKLHPHYRWSINPQLTTRYGQKGGYAIDFDLSGCCSFSREYPLGRQVFQIGESKVFYSAPFNTYDYCPDYYGGNFYHACGLAGRLSYETGAYFGGMADFSPQKSTPYIDPAYNRSYIPIRPFADTLVVGEVHTWGIKEILAIGGDVDERARGSMGGFRYIDKTIHLFAPVYTDDGDIYYIHVIIPLGKPVNKRTAYVTMGDTKKKVTIYEMSTKYAEVILTKMWRIALENEAIKIGDEIHGYTLRDFSPATEAIEVPLLRGRIKIRYPLENVNGRLYVPIRVYNDILPQTTIDWHGDEKVFVFNWWAMKSGEEVYRTLKQRMYKIEDDHFAELGNIPASHVIGAQKYWSDITGKEKQILEKVREVAGMWLYDSKTDEFKRYMCINPKSYNPQLGEMYKFKCDAYAKFLKISK